MSNRNPLNSLSALLTALFLALLLSPALARAEQDTEDTLGLFTAWQEQSSTASRAPKPLSQTAENTTVVTQTEIEALNAHTLADVLDTVPGIQIIHNGGPGITAYPLIQSSNFRHVQVFVDGVSITNLAGDFSDVHLIPARIIERIEIVKGAASSSWGQALGGVVYVVTKTPDKERTLGGTATASIGQSTTTDSGAELTGTSGGVGYYLSGGYLGSNGLLPGTQVNADYAHAKLTYDLPTRGQLFAIFDYFKTHQGDLFVPDYDLKERTNKRMLMGTLGLRYPLTESLELEVIGRHSYQHTDTSWYNISDGATWIYQPDLPTGIYGEEASGASVKLTWRTSSNLLVAGSDYNHEEVKSNTIDTVTLTPFSRKVERYGIYLNDTLTLGPVSIAPGARFDHTQTSCDQFSPSLGATWQLDDKTVLRAYTARGYGLPELTFLDAPSVKIWTAQVGAESTAIPYLWLKGTLFRNMVWGEGMEQHLALGTELEARTTPILNTSLGAGYTFTDTTRTSGGEVNGLPRHTVQLALRYDDKTLRGVLTGRHLFLNRSPGEDGKYGGLIWDLHLGAILLKREYTSLELFFSGHNLFNGSQFESSMIPNTGRWFEGGMKVRF